MADGDGVPFQQSIQWALGIEAQLRELGAQIGTTQGPKGDPGDAGPPGSNGTDAQPARDGRAGRDGADGKDGEKGDQGDQGDPTVAVSNLPDLPPAGSVAVGQNAYVVTQRLPVWSTGHSWADARGNEVA